MCSHIDLGDVVLMTVRSVLQGNMGASPTYESAYVSLMCLAEWLRFGVWWVFRLGRVIGVADTQRQSRFIAHTLYSDALVSTTTVSLQ